MEQSVIKISTNKFQPIKIFSMKSIKTKTKITIKSPNTIPNSFNNTKRTILRKYTKTVIN